MTAARPPAIDRHRLERTIVSGLLADPAAALGQCRNVGLEPADLPTAGAVLVAVADLLGRGVAVDLVSVSEELRAVGALETPGSVAALADLGGEIVDPASIGRYAARLRQASVLLGLPALAEGAVADPLSLDGLEAAVAEARRLGQADLGKSAYTTAAELAAMVFPPIRWAVPGILPEGLSILAGPPKVGKSMLALAIAEAVAAGGVVLGSVPVEAGTAVYFGLEDSLRRLRKRLAMWSRPEDFTARLILATSLAALDKGGLAEIERLITGTPDIRLIVLDTFARVRPERHRGADPYQADVTALAPLQALAQRYGVAILVVHHTRKTDRKTGEGDALEAVSGTLGLTGVCDAVLVLRRGRMTDTGTLAVISRECDDASLGLHFDRGLWTLVGTAAEVALSTERREILDALAAATEPMTARDVTTETGGKYENVKRLLLRMAVSGEIAKFKPGHYVTRPTIKNISPPCPCSPSGPSGPLGPFLGNGDSGDRGGLTPGPHVEANYHNTSQGVGTEGTEGTALAEIERLAAGLVQIEGETTRAMPADLSEAFERAAGAGDLAACRDLAGRIASTIGVNDGNL